jgi:hypothetical protein
MEQSDIFDLPDEPYSGTELPKKDFIDLKSMIQYNEFYLDDTANFRYVMPDDKDTLEKDYESNAKYTMICLPLGKSILSAAIFGRSEKVENEWRLCISNWENPSHLWLNIIVKPELIKQTSPSTKNRYFIPFTIEKDDWYPAIFEQKLSESEMVPLKMNLGYILLFNDTMKYAYKSKDCVLLQPLDQLLISPRQLVISDNLFCSQIGKTLLTVTIELRHPLENKSSMFDTEDSIVKYAKTLSKEELAKYIDFYTWYQVNYGLTRPHLLPANAAIQTLTSSKTADATFAREGDRSFIRIFVKSDDFDSLKNGLARIKFEALLKTSVNDVKFISAVPRVKMVITPAYDTPAKKITKEPPLIIREPTVKVTEKKKEEEIWYPPEKVSIVEKKIDKTTELDIVQGDLHLSRYVRNNNDIVRVRTLISNYADLNEKIPLGEFTSTIKLIGDIKKLSEVTSLEHIAMDIVYDKKTNANLVQLVANYTKIPLNKRQSYEHVVSGKGTPSINFHFDPIKIDINPTHKPPLYLGEMKTVEKTPGEEKTPLPIIKMEPIVLPDIALPSTIVLEEYGEEVTQMTSPRTEKPPPKKKRMTKKMQQQQSLMKLKDDIVNIFQSGEISVDKRKKVQDLSFDFKPSDAGKKRFAAIKLQDVYCIFNNRIRGSSSGAYNDCAFISMILALNSTTATGDAAYSLFANEPGFKKLSTHEEKLNYAINYYRFMYRIGGKVFGGYIGLDNPMDEDRMNKLNRTNGNSGRLF